MTHGENTTYTKLGCRCKECKAAHAFSQQMFRDRRKAQRLPEVRNKSRYVARLSHIFPVEPLLDAIEQWAIQETQRGNFHDQGNNTGFHAACQLLNIGGSRLYRGVGAVFSYQVVDRVCCAIRMHPSQVYGYEWTAAELARPSATRHVEVA